MLQLDSSQTLTTATQAELTKLQAKVNNKVSFAEKAAKAQSLWHGINSPPTKKAAFAEIREKLKKMCVSVLKLDIKAGFKKDILQHAHPSVWAAIKLVDSKATPKWRGLFQQLPEVLNW